MASIIRTPGWRRWVVAAVLGAVAGFLVQETLYRARVARYAREHVDLAIEEERISGIPAEIKLAQGVHETDAGRSRLANEANNHFGIKCGKGWTGPSVAHDDDSPGECFRKYDDVRASYRDHSRLLSRDRYRACFALPSDDFEGWARELKKAGYATDPLYAEKIIRIVRIFDRAEIDRRR